MTHVYADAIAKLEADHDRIEALFAKLKKADEAKTREIGVHVCNLVKIHMMLEEEFLYPALRGEPQANEDKLDEGLVEHDSGKVLLNDVLANPDDDKVGSKLQVLGEHMEHHHKEEEDPGKGIFEMARRAKLDLKAMLSQMETREAVLRSDGQDGDLPTAEMNFVEVEASRE